MQQYELLFILPGTLAESEVQPVVDAVAAVITDRGGKVVRMDDMGKSRLAYPMKHIRYGYFRLCQFEAGYEQVPLIQQKLRLINELLRSLIVKRDAKSLGARQVQFISPISSVEREPVNSQFAEPEAVRAEAAPREVAVPVAVAPETKKIPLEDIDKKLDEILEKDITDTL